jgi:predicted nucleotide-binding protein
MQLCDEVTSIDQMARKPAPPPPTAPRTPLQIKQGIERIQRRIAELEAFQPESVKERWAPETKAIGTSISDTLDSVFGHNSQRFHRFSGAARLDKGGVVIGGGPTPLHKVHQGLTEGKADSLALLRQAVKSLEEDLADLGDEPVIPPLTQDSGAPASDEIFIVHGRDTPAKTEVVLLIERAGLKPIVLHEQANNGKTIIEKFEKHGSAVGFAVIVATPDDVGGLAVAPPAAPELKPRARQNVIGEMFWFAGRLGREKVCALVKGDIEMPSDFAGVVYTPMDVHGGWKSKLLQELEAAGYDDINWREALK